MDSGKSTTCGADATQDARSVAELPGVMWVASGSEESNWFAETHCCDCTKDAAANGTIYLYDARGHELCPIIGDACFEPVKEWRKLPDGKLICTQFQPKDEPGLTRCPHTIELDLTGA